MGLLQYLKSTLSSEKRVERRGNNTLDIVDIVDNMYDVDILDVFRSMWKSMFVRSN